MVNTASPLYIQVNSTLSGIAFPRLSKAFNAYFTSVFTHEDLSSIPHIGGTSFPILVSITISTDEVVHQLAT